MTSEERALKFLTMTDSDERVIQLTRLFDQHATEARKDQAEKCGAAAARVVIADGGQPSRPDIVKVACLNAVEKSDE